ncbi:MAG: HTH domain-containing protein [Methylococcaceae bacterium]|nr:HTH domain-containing protein [Methylococcaceae bacterium]MDD1607204.1 HTH domain-containing protein [Methylococcaceae bacterium]MDD1609788.1 HTH domain-containing protein [Methylococcaceae bacterium]MDD1615933.1 HTH domain-containing protein [Methylococcaceae bacterium]OYV19054.1 MAG: putative transcriptional regulator [Methylococcaceae bacterium NSP1-2]
MIDSFSVRQQDILKIMLENKDGVTIDDLAQRLSISRNAIRQHLSAMERDTLIKQLGTRPSMGRPELLYGLANKGREKFPRHYSWFSELLMTALFKEVGSDGLTDKVKVMGENVAQDLLSRRRPPESTLEAINDLNKLMVELGYSSRVKLNDEGEIFIEANNCVFHDLAEKHPEVCQFDLALMSSFTKTNICHEECMVRGGKVCRFKFNNQ